MKERQNKTKTKMKRRIPRTWGKRNNIGRKEKTLGYSSDALEQGNREIRETGKKTTTE